MRCNSALGGLLFFYRTSKMIARCGLHMADCHDPFCPTHGVVDVEKQKKYTARFNPSGHVRRAARRPNEGRMASRRHPRSE